MLIILLVPFTIFAQEGKEGLGVAEAEKVQTLQSTTVTARKAEESAKDVPFSLSVISGNELENRRLANLEDALRQTPGIEVDTYGGSDTRNIRIRGVGSLESVSMDDTSVVINVDGVPQAVASATLNIMDIERVEILKGPQGTLMGRNSEAGAINIITKKPTRHLEGYLKGEYGTENTFLTEGAVSGPVSKTVSMRLAAKYSGYDNQVEYYNSTEPITEPRNFAVRATLLWEPTDKTDVTFSIGHEDIDNMTGADILAPYDDEQKTDIPKDSYDTEKSVDRFTLIFEHEFSAFDFTSVTGYVHTDANQQQYIYNGMIYREFYGFVPEGSMTRELEQKAFSQELRLSSKSGSDIFWVTGANYYRSERDLNNVDAYDTFYSIGWYNADLYKTFETTDIGVFGEVTYPVTDKLKLTGGLRYTWDKKEYDTDWTANPSNPSTIRTASDSDEMSESYGTGRVSVSYAVREDTNVYLTYARGHKAKGYNDWGNAFINGYDNDLIYDEAEIDSFELGAKFEAPNGKSGLNVAFFYNDIKDDHVMVWNHMDRVSDVENFDTESKGAEFSGFVKPGGGFTITAGFGYTDAEIKTVPGGSTSGAKEGNSIPNSPEWNATVSIAHSLSLKPFWGFKAPALVTTVTNRYIGSREGDPANTFELDSYNKLDFRIGVMSENLEVYVWGDNILDKVYDLYGWNYGASMVDGADVIVGMPSRGRILGVGAAYYF
ncbi:TonB-dependent receptor [Denitrovibrio acetiphilus]|uniref:TonB-dependent receptor n=1 Tax=Denitrovibrio acetiphilus TaxID=118000 RepID=UPI001B7FBA1F|nr:TonB-dependent receptor [Denitrovibrio acetiphilus]